MRSEICHDCDVARGGDQKHNQINKCDYGMPHCADDRVTSIYNVEQFLMESGIYVY